MDYGIAFPQILYLGVALVIGLMVGLERGWQKRYVREGQRVAGVRTYAILRLSGGICALLSLELGSPLIFGLAVFALAIMLTSAHVVSSLALQ